MNYPLPVLTPPTTPYLDPVERAGHTLWDPATFAVWRLPLSNRSGIVDAPKGYVWNGFAFVPPRPEAAPKPARKRRVRKAA